MKAVLSITLLYFLVSILAIYFIIRKKPSDGRRLLLKYGMYFLIVYASILIIYVHWFLYELLFILLFGLYEIIYLKTKHPLQVSTFYFSLFIYVVVAILSIIFNVNASFPQLLLLYMTVFVFDGFSQLFGQLFGTRKMVPRISPGKTLVGFIGGVGMALVSSKMASVNGFSYTLSQTLFIVAGAFLGDLLASWYKRLIGVKDYNQIIPGHGGFLDRFDSLLGACVVGCVLINI
jgi:phosphatidate cytidylyltransferase